MSTQFNTSNMEDDEGDMWGGVVVESVELNQLEPEEDQAEAILRTSSSLGLSDESLVPLAVSPEGITHTQSSDQMQAMVAPTSTSYQPNLMRSNVLLTLSLLAHIRKYNLKNGFKPTKSLGNIAEELNISKSNGGRPQILKKRKSLASISYIGSGASQTDLYNSCDHLADLHENSTFKHGSSRSGRNSYEEFKPIAEIDFVISGGGMKGYFATGCVDVLKHALDHNNMRIARLAGASAGAWAGMFAILNISTSFWMETYFTCQEHPDKLIHEVYEEMLMPWLKAAIPKDAYKQCSGKLFISISVVTWRGLENQIISEFHSNDDLYECLLASSTIPFMTERCWWGREFRGMHVLDGGLTNNTPIFADGNNRQLVLRLYDVEYPWRLLTSPLDSCIDALVLRGALLMDRFLRGQQEGLTAIAWVEKKESKAQFMRATSGPNYFFRRVVLAPLCIAGIVGYRGGSGVFTSLLPSVLKSVFTGNHRTNELLAIIPFAEASSLFSTNMLQAWGTVMFTAVVDALRSLNLLL